MGLQSTLHTTSATRNWAGFQVVAGIGFGLLFTATTFPILAPLAPSDNAAALSLFIFVRSFFQVRSSLVSRTRCSTAFCQAWGITIGSTVLQNQLKSRLPPSFLSSLPAGLEITYAAIPTISSLAEPQRRQVQDAFADSLDVLWQVMIGLAGLGFLSSLIMREINMSAVTDERFGLDHNQPALDHEAQSAAGPEKTSH